MKKWTGWLAGIFFLPVFILILLIILIYIPPIQNYVRKKAVDIVSKSTGFDVAVERVRLSFPLALEIDGVKALADGDTLLLVDRLVADVELLPLLHGVVNVDGIRLKGAEVNTKNLIPGLVIRGNISNMFLRSEGIDFGKETVVLDEFQLDDSYVKLCLADTTASDTVKTTLNWKIRIDKVDINNVGFDLDMPLDTLKMVSYVGSSRIRNGVVDLGSETYSLEKIVLDESSFGMLTSVDAGTDVFNPADMKMTDIRIEMDSLLYSGKRLNLLLKDVKAREKSGLNLVSASGHIYSDNNNIYADGISLKTEESDISLDASLGWNVIEMSPEGQMELKADLSLGIPDIEYFVGKLHKDIPRKPLVAKLRMGGSFDKMNLSEASVVWDRIFVMTATGGAEHLLDSISRTAKINVGIKTGNINFAKKALNLTESGVRFPQKMQMFSEIEYADNACTADVELVEGKSNVKFIAGYGLKDDSYRMNLMIDSLVVQHFYAIDSLSPVTLNLKAEGKGFDLYSKRTVSKINARIEQLAYSDYDLSNTRLKVNFDKSAGNLTLKTNNGWIKSNVALNMNIGRKDSSAKLDIDIRKLGLQKIVGLDSPFDIALNIDLDAGTDMKETATLIGRIGDAVFDVNGKKVNPKDIVFEAYTSPDVSEFSVNAGDLFMTVNGDKGATKLADMITAFYGKLGEQLAAHSLDYNELKEFLPDLYFEFTADNDNPVSNYLKMMNVSIDSSRLRLDCNPVRGIAGDFLLNEIKIDSITLDSAYLWLVQDTTGIKYKLSAVNNSSLSEYVSNAVISGEIAGHFANILIDMYNQEGDKGLYLGCNADFGDTDMKLSFFPDNPAFLFRQYELNNGNYVILGDSSKIDADLRIIDSNGTGLSLVSSFTKFGNRRLTASLSGIDLNEIKALAPSLIPDISGVVSASLSYTRLKKTFSLSSSLNVDNFIYERKPVADLGLTLNYLPLEDETQMVMAKMNINDKETVTIRGKYRPGENREFIYNMDLKDFPLDIANSFVPEDMLNLQGTTNGKFVMTGSFAKPIFNGNMSFSNTSVYIPMAGAKFRLEDKELIVKDSRLNFDNFSLFTRTDNPFDIKGTVDFSDFSDIGVDMRFKTSDYELLNARKTKESVVYGKVNIDADVWVNGPVSNLKVRGDLKMLGNTNLSYILKESSLTVQDRLGETVTFMNFRDTVSVDKEEVVPVTINGMDVLLNASIDPTAKVNIYLSDTGDNKIEVAGGGDLSMTYSPQGDLSLTGRYTFSGGKITYSLPMVTIADFSVREGGFIQWTGNPMAPTMNLSAVKRVRTDVPNSNGEGSHKTNFDVSVNIYNTLDNLGLSFGIDAPEDADVQNELTAMGEDERVKNALFMIAFNSYLGNGANFNVNNALNSLIQSEISNVAGKVKAVDLSLGMENPNGEEGLENMDISYKISKRFWNDRFSISLGGKISTGNDASESNKESFIDNISVEYRLDNSGTRYVKLFHNKNYESVLEGEITETGLGVVLKKKMLRLGELFIFKRNRNKTDKDEKVK